MSGYVGALAALLVVGSGVLGALTHAALWWATRPAGGRPRDRCCA